jgi:hypothetical protein
VNYFEHNDSKGRDARLFAQAFIRDRARARKPFDGALFMNADALSTRRLEGGLLAFFDGDYGAPCLQLTNPPR